MPININRAYVYISSEIVLSPYGLQDIVKRIQKVREENSITTNNVNLRLYPDGNGRAIKNQLDTFLRNRGFGLGYFYPNQGTIPGIIVKKDDMPGCVAIEIGTVNPNDN